MLELILATTIAFNVDVHIGAESAYDEMCRGSTEPESRLTAYACKRRDEVNQLLFEAGWCLGSPRVTAKWHKCTESDKKAHLKNSD